MSLLNYFNRLPSKPTSSSSEKVKTLPSTALSSQSITEDATSSTIIIATSSVSLQVHSIPQKQTIGSVPSDLGIDSPSQPKVPFPSTTFGTKLRNFSQNWYLGRSWLEYSIEKDAAFCFCCRMFCTSSYTGENTFRETGFKNWKSALEKGRGLNQHELSTDHIRSMCAWKELQLRQVKNKEVSTLVNENVLFMNRYYMTSVLDVIKFLAVNELPLRGDVEEDDNCPHSGLFKQLFRYTINKDTKLAEAMKCIPKVATYHSPDMQNEIISELAKMVQKKIVDKVIAADVPYFSIKVDGTKDTTGTENISIVVRSVSEGKPFEHLLSIATSVKVNAEALATVIIDTLVALGLDPQCILSQCYDGAAVMSGIHGGVQVKINSLLNKTIPYVHCYNHKLHLVVIHAISEDVRAQSYCDTCSILYNFFRKPNVSKLYEGEHLKRLLPQRWTGHLRTTKVILDNYDEIKRLLQSCTREATSTEINIEASGILWKVSSLEFVFIANLLNTLLSILEPLNASLQSKSMDLLTANDLVSAVIETIKRHRSDDNFLCTYQASLKLTQPEEDMAPKPKRKRVTPKSLSQYIVTENVGAASEMSVEMEFKQLYMLIIDRAVSELQTRFSAANQELLLSMKSLTAFSDANTFFNTELLKNIATLCAVDLKGAQHEIETAKVFLQSKFDSNTISATQPTLHDVTEFMYKYKDAFPVVYRLLASAICIGASSSTCEATFSTLTRVLTPYRQSMLHSR